MRVSVDKNDQGYSPNIYRIIDKIYLNGTPMIHVVTADDESGVVIFYCTDENGNFMLDDDENIMVGTLTGDVEIIFKEGFGEIDLHRIH